MRNRLLDYSFIRLKTSKQEAFNLDNSPVINLSYLGQIQLLPLDPFPYVQTTDFTINYFGDSTSFNAYLVDCDGNEEDLNSHFKPVVGQDINGIFQLQFKLAYLPKDYGQNLVYLKIIAITGDLRYIFYSNKFKITREDEFLTSRVDYSLFKPLTFGENTSPSEFNSIRLPFYLHDHIDKDEISTYLMISNGEHVNSSTIHSDLTEWVFEYIDYFTNTRLKRAIQRGLCYINGVANQSTESFEYEGRYGRSNISTTKFITDQDEGDVYTPEEMIVFIPDPESDFTGWVFLNGEEFTNMNNEELAFL